MESLHICFLPHTYTHYARGARQLSKPVTVTVLVSTSQHSALTCWYQLKFLMWHSRTHIRVSTWKYTISWLNCIVWQTVNIRTALPQDSHEQLEILILFGRFKCTWHFYTTNRAVSAKQLTLPCCLGKLKDFAVPRKKEPTKYNIRRDNSTDGIHAEEVIYLELL